MLVCDVSNSQIVTVFDTEVSNDEDNAIQFKNKSLEYIHAFSLQEFLRSSTRRKQRSKILTSTPLNEELDEKKITEIQKKYISC